MAGAEADDVVFPAGESDHLAIGIPETAHKISQDSWLQVGMVLTTGINSAYVLGYPGTIMAPLGWTGGVVGLIIAPVISMYANSLVAKFHEYGGRRHIRYRDLVGFIYGRKVYSLTWALQYVNLFMINIGYVILGGNSLKALYLLFRDDDVMKLPHFIALAGVACIMFAISVPHLSDLGVWMGFSMLFTLLYVVIAVVLAIKDGMESSPRDYTIRGTPVDKIFTIIGASANLAFAFNTGMLPEIQATVRQPVVENTMKALYFHYSIGATPLYLVTFIGYWAYGSNVSTYLLNNVHGPLWLKATANVAAFLQSIISLHIFACPTYEFLDTKYGIKGSSLDIRSLTFRALVRGSYLGLTTFISALLPFLGDFMSLTGAISTFPLTFILGNHMYLRVKESKLSPLQVKWHWFNVWFFAFMAAAACVAALRLIAVDSSTYHLFANV